MRSNATGYAVEAGRIDQGVEFVLLLRRFDAVRRDALDRLIVDDIDQQHVVAVEGLEITALQRHAPSAETVILRDQFPPRRSGPSRAGGSSWR